MTTEQRITIQFLTIWLSFVLQSANEQEFMKAKEIIEKSNVPEVVKRNLIKNGRRQTHEIS